MKAQHIFFTVAVFLFATGKAQHTVDHPWNGTFPLFTFCDTIGTVTSNTGLTNRYLFTTTEDVSARLSKPTVYSGTVQLFNENEGGWPIVYYSPYLQYGNIGGSWVLSNGLLAFHHEVYPTAENPEGKNEFVLLNPKTLATQGVVSKTLLHGTMDSHGFDIHNNYGMLVDFKMTQAVAPEATALYTNGLLVDSVLNDVILWYKPSGEIDTIYAYPQLFPLGAVSWAIVNDGYKKTGYADISHFNSLRFYAGNEGHAMMLVSLKNAGLIAYDLQSKKVEWAIYNTFCGTPNEPMMNTFARPLFGHDGRCISPSVFSYFDNGSARLSDEVHRGIAEGVIYKLEGKEFTRTKAINTGILSGAMGSYQPLDNGSSVVSWGGNILIAENKVYKSLSVFNEKDVEITYTSLPGYNVVYAANAITVPVIQRPEIECVKVLADSVQLLVKGKWNAVNWSNGEKGAVGMFPKNEVACVSVTIDSNDFISLLSREFSYTAQSVDDEPLYGSDNMNAYWNEANDEIQVYVPASSKFSLYDNLGAYVIRGKFKPGFNTIKTKGCTAGLYRLKTTGAGGLANRKIFIKR